MVMQRRRNVSSEITSFDTDNVPALSDIDNALAYKILLYFRSREQDSFTFRAKTIALYVDGNVNKSTIYSPTTGRKVSMVLDEFIRKGLITADERRPRRYWGSKSRIDSFLRGMTVESAKNVKRTDKRD